MTLDDPGRSPLAPAVLAWAEEVAREVEEDHSTLCAVFVFDPSREGLALVALQGEMGEEAKGLVSGGWTVPLDGSVCGHVFRTGQPALLADVAQESTYRTYPGSRGRSELAVPIVAGDRTIGVLNLESPRPASFDIADLTHLRAAAERAGAAFVEAGLLALLERSEGH